MQLSSRQWETSYPNPNPNVQVFSHGKNTARIFHHSSSILRTKPSEDSYTIWLGHYR